MDRTECCLWMVMTFGAGNAKIWKMIERFKTPENVYNSLKNNKCDFLSAKESEAVRTTHIEQSAYVRESCASKNIKIISFYDEDYPKQLKNIFNPPIILFVQGDISTLDDLCITVVGAREPSEYSVKVTRKICSEMVKVGVVIVSGFALGIDSVAHRSAVVNGGKTIAVLGCGIDVDYPKENTKSKSAVSKRGLLITEFLPGTRPVAPNFPKRNRILSALSSGTLVIEASKVSGSLITAEYAVEQGRDLFCIPPADIFDNRYSGVVKYLRDGAIPVFSHLDIIREYYTAFTHKLSSINQNADYSEPVSESSVFTTESSGKNHKTDKKITVKNDESLQKKESFSKDYSNLDEDQTAVVDILRDGTKYIDEISELSGINVSSLYLILTDLEMDGVVECLPGKAYKLI